MCGFLGCSWLDMEFDKCHLGFVVSMLRKHEQCVDNLTRACLLQMAPFQTYQLLREKKLLGQTVVRGPRKENGPSVAGTEGPFNCRKRF